MTAAHEKLASPGAQASKNDKTIAYDKWLVMRLALAGVALAAYIASVAIMMPLIPSIQAEYFEYHSSCAMENPGSCTGEASAAASAYNGVASSINALGIFVLSPIYGEASDRYGRKLLLCFSWAVKLLPYTLLWIKPDAVPLYCVWIALSGLAPSSESLYFAICADLVPTGKRMQFFGWFSACGMAAFSLGAGLSAVLQAAYSPNFLLGLGVCLSSVSLAAIALFVPETAPSCKRHRGPFLPVEPNLEAPLNLEDEPVKQKSKGEIVHQKSVALILAGQGNSNEERMLRCTAWIGLVSQLPQEGVGAVSSFYVKMHLGLTGSELSMLGGWLACLIGVSGFVWQTAGFSMLKRICGSNSARIYQALLGVNFLHVLGYILMWSPSVFLANAALAGGPMAQPTMLRAMVSQAVPSHCQGRAAGVLTSVGGACSAVAPVLFSSLLLIGTKHGVPWMPYALCMSLIVVSGWLTSWWLVDAVSKSEEKDEKREALLKEEQRDELLGA